MKRKNSYDMKLFGEDFTFMLNNGHVIEVKKYYNGNKILKILDINNNEQVKRALQHGFEYSGTYWFKHYEVQR